MNKYPYMLTETTIREAASLWLEEFIAPLRSYNLILEGVNDPGILKCVFMAGGPGSGKSYVAADLFGIDTKMRASFSSTGLKLIDSDRAFVYMLQKNGINPRELATIERDNPDLWNELTVGSKSVRAIAKHLTNKQKEFYQQGRLGMIIDGTGENIEKITQQKNEAESMGYDTFMVFVNTSLAVALARNNARERRLPKDLVETIWGASQQNRTNFQRLFGENFVEIDNSNPGRVPGEIQKIVNRFVRKPIQNEIGYEWFLMAQAFSTLKT